MLHSVQRPALPTDTASANALRTNHAACRPQQMQHRTPHPQSLSTCPHPHETHTTPHTLIPHLGTLFPSAARSTAPPQPQRKFTSPVAHALPRGSAHGSIRNADACERTRDGDWDGSGGVRRPCYAWLAGYWFAGLAGVFSLGRGTAWMGGLGCGLGRWVGFAARGDMLLLGSVVWSVVRGCILMRDIKGEGDEETCARVW